jgi:hypothetical protein
VAVEWGSIATTLSPASSSRKVSLARRDASPLTIKMGFAIERFVVSMTAVEMRPESHVLFN